MEATMWRYYYYKCATYQYPGGVASIDICVCPPFLKIYSLSAYLGCISLFWLFQAAVVTLWEEWDVFHGNESYTIRNKYMPLFV
jgi:hypothetical protein